MSELHKNINDQLSDLNKLKYVLFDWDNANVKQKRINLMPSDLPGSIPPQSWRHRSLHPRRRRGESPSHTVLSLHEGSPSWCRNNTEQDTSGLWLRNKILSEKSETPNSIWQHSHYKKVQKFKWGFSYFSKIFPDCHVVSFQNFFHLLTCHVHGIGCTEQ